MNPLNSGSRLFSKLAQITDEDKTPFGDFHFRLVYPEGILEWVQSNNPFNSSVIENFNPFIEDFMSFNGESWKKVVHLYQTRDHCRAWSL